MIIEYIFQNCIEDLIDQSNTNTVDIFNNSMKQQRGGELLTKVTQSISSVSQSADSDFRDCEATERVANEMTRYSDKDNSYLLTLVQAMKSGHKTLKDCVTDAAHRLRRSDNAIRRKLCKLTKTNGTEKPLSNNIKMATKSKFVPNAYTDKENEILLKAWVAIQSGKSTILESSKNLAKIIHRSPACLYQKLFRIGRAQKASYSARQQHKDQRLTNEHDSSSSEDCESSEEPRPAKRRYRAYSAQETRLLADATQRILQGDLTMTEAVERLLGVMRRSKRGLDTKLRHMVTDSTAAAASHYPSTSTPLLHQLSTAAHSGHTRADTQHHHVPTTATHENRDPGNQSDAMSLEGLDCWQGDATPATIETLSHHSLSAYW